MIVYPNAKINLGLRIIDKRKDGYHNIESVFVPIPVHDILEVNTVEGTNEMRLSVSGISLPLDSDNILFKCYALFKTHCDMPSVECHLHKQIPFGAGLGGGSADAVFFCELLNGLLEKPMSDTDLDRLLLSVGSDCLFFRHNTPSFISGIGEIIRPTAVDLSGLFLVLIQPEERVSTIEAYQKCIPSGKHINEAILSDRSQWRALVNDFEETVFKDHPGIGELKQQLLDNGAIYASMSGSGSSVFGLFDREQDLELYDYPFKTQVGL